MKDRWSQLSMSEKSDLMSLYIRNGISSLEEIKKHYNSYQVGGPVSEKTPNFVQRINEGNKRDIPFQGGHATHLLSYAERDGKYYVFPEVQPTDYNNSNSPLQYYGRDWRVAFDRAYDNNDYLEFDTEEAARNYSENYKKIPNLGAVLNGPNRGNYNILDYMRGFATGGHLYQDGGFDDEDKIYAASSVYKAMPDITITAERPAWQRGLTDYDWARARQYYSNPDGTLTPRGFEFLKNVASKRTTGQSDYMRDVNKLSYIPNAAVGAIGAVPVVAGAIAATTNPVIDAILTTEAAIHTPKNIENAVENIKKGNTWQGVGELGLTTLDLTGAGQLLGRTGKMLNKGYRAEHAFNSIIPISYENMGNRSKQWFNNMWYNTKQSSEKLRNNYERETYEALRKNQELSEDTVNQLVPIIANNREDAFRLYLGMPQKYNTYTRLNNGNYRMNEESIPDILLPYLNSKADPGFTHGGLHSADFYMNPELKSGVWHYTDSWDLNPLQRKNLSPVKRVTKRLENFEKNLMTKAQNYRSKKYESGKWGNGYYPWLDKTLNVFRTDGRMPWQKDWHDKSYIKQISNSLENSKTLQQLESKIKDIEVGPFLGGKPFMMETVIPFKVTEDEIKRIYGLTEDELNGFESLIKPEYKILSK